MAVPYTFGSATTSIPLSQLDSNFATTITLGNTAIQLGNTVTTLNNMTLANVAVTSTNGDITINTVRAGLGNASVSTNTAFGVSALATNSSGSSSTAVGYLAGSTNTTGASVTAFGYQAGKVTTTTNSGTYIGANSGLAATGQQNTFLGQGSGETVTSGAKNTIIGRYDGNTGGLDIRTSSNYIVLSDGDGNPRVSWGSTGAMSMNNAVSGTGNIRVTNSSNTSGDVNVIALLGANAINTSSYAWISGQNGAGDKCYIYGNGNIQNLNNSYGGISDVKLKENIVDSGSQWNDIKAIRVRKYSMKADALTAPNMLGVIAQELEASGMNKLVFESPDRQNEGEVIKQVNYSILYMKADALTAPNMLGVIAQELEESGMNKLVFESPDRQNEGEVIKQVNYSILYMKAVKALQEAMERIETLETKSDTQAETINALTARIVALEAK
jgi:hypothetical protein